MNKRTRSALLQEACLCDDMSLHYRNWCFCNSLSFPTWCAHSINCCTRVSHGVTALAQGLTKLTPAESRPDFGHRYQHSSAESLAAKHVTDPPARSHQRKHSAAARATDASQSIETLDAAAPARHGACLLNSSCYVVFSICACLALLRGVFDSLHLYSIRVLI